MRFRFMHRAEEFERFALNAFDGAIGKPFTLNHLGKTKHQGTLVAAEVAEDGRSVELTVDVPGLSSRDPVLGGFWEGVSVRETSSGDTSVRG